MGAGCQINVRLKIFWGKANGLESGLGCGNYTGRNNLLPLKCALEALGAKDHILTLVARLLAGLLGKLLPQSVGTNFAEFFSLWGQGFI